MTFLDKLERRFGKFAIQNLSPIIVFGQVVVFIILTLGLMDPSSVRLAGQHVMDGQVYRLGMFVFYPPDMNILWAIIQWWLFLLMGNALEKKWGAFRYNLYLLIAVIMTISCSFIYPTTYITNSFIGASVFFAFAFLFPDFILHLFFVLPVKIKYLAYLGWAGIALVIITATDPSTKVIAIASVANFLLFFGKDFINMAKAKKRREAFKASTTAMTQEAFHTCGNCGITDKTNPQAVFRYCSECEPATGYCDKHFADHKHLTGNQTPTDKSGNSADRRKIDNKRYTK